MASSIIDLRLPRSWEELTPAQMRDLYAVLMSDTLDPWDVRVCMAMRWGGLRMLGHGEDGTHAVRVTAASGAVHDVELSDGELHFICGCLAWTDDLPRTPRTPGRIGGRRPPEPRLHGAALETFLTLDNLFHGFLTTLDRRMLRRMASVMYPLPPWRRPLHRLAAMLRPLRPAHWQLTAVFFWFAALKREYASLYPNLLRGGGSKSVSADTLRRSVNSMLRALTKGDVTKEETVRATEVHRALTELDFLAMEAEELKRRSKRR